MISSSSAQPGARPPPRSDTISGIEEETLESLQHPGPFRDIRFEDLDAGIFPVSDFAEDRSAEPQLRKVRRPKKPPPMTDEELREVDLRTLPRDQFFWAVGRAASLRWTAPQFWQNLSEAIALHGGEAGLRSMELCKLVQALAYVPTQVRLEEAQIRRVLKAFATRSSEFDAELFSRVVYAFARLASKRGLRMRSFVDFVSSECVERGRQLKSWRKVRILEALAHLPETNDDFKRILIGEVIQDIRDLDAECLAVFAPMMVDMNFHQRPGVLERVNACFLRKLKHPNFTSPDLILHSGLPLVLYDILKTSVLAKWLERLCHLKIPLTAGAVARVGREPDSMKDVAAPELDDMPPAEQEEPPSAPPGKVLLSGLPADPCRAAANLEALKTVEMCLRHERPEVLKVFSPRVTRFLSTVREMPLEPPQDYQMYELPFVVYELRWLMQKVGLLLHPTIYGPYLLELSDPLGRVVVEWDSSWTLYKPWRQARHRDFVLRKHRHLLAEGWRVVQVPLAEFKALHGHEAKVEFARRIVRLHGLQELSQNSADS